MGLGIFKNPMMMLMGSRVKNLWGQQIWRRAKWQGGEQDGSLKISKLLLKGRESTRHISSLELRTRLPGRHPTEVYLRGPYYWLQQQETVRNLKRQLVK